MSMTIDPLLDNPHRVSFDYGQHKVTLETGAIARQTDAAIMVTVGDTVVLVTVVGRKEGDPSKGFLPLTIIYQEKTYAAGKIPGSFFRREGRPSEAEVLIARLIDRPLRPLFPAHFYNEVQVVATVISLDPQVSPDIPAMIGASAALYLSGIPFAGPIGGARVGYIDNNFVMNPTTDELATSQLNLVVAGTKAAVLMVESEAKELSEEVMLEAVMFGHQQMQTAISAIHELSEKAGRTEWSWQPPATDSSIHDSIAQTLEPALAGAYQVPDKKKRQDELNVLREKVYAEHVNEENEQTTARAEFLALIR